MPIFVVSLLIQLALVVHIIKSGRNARWVFIVLIFPLIGSVAYLIVELVPELLDSRTGRQMRRRVGDVINPNRNLNAASQSFARADTVQNAIRLAEECLGKELFEEARALYARSLKGVHADDPQLLLGLARAQFGLGEFGDVRKTLDDLKETNPDFRSADGHLLYARTLEALGDIDGAIHEYEALFRYYAGPEPAYRLALLLKQRGDGQRANELLEKILQDSRYGGRHYNELHKEWILAAKRDSVSVI